MMWRGGFFYSTVAIVEWRWMDELSFFYIRLRVWDVATTTTITTLPLPVSRCSVDYNIPTDGWKMNIKKTLLHVMAYAPKKIIGSNSRHTQAWNFNPGKPESNEYICDVTDGDMYIVYIVIAWPIVLTIFLLNGTQNGIRCWTGNVVRGENVV